MYLCQVNKTETSDYSSAVVTLLTLLPETSSANLKKKVQIERSFTGCTAFVCAANIYTSIIFKPVLQAWLFTCN